MMTGLYHPEEFRDNCGFGLIAHMKGDASHKLLQTAIESLTCMTHRGGIAADGKTGDGCGLLIQSPMPFCAKLRKRSLARSLKGSSLWVRSSLTRMKPRQQQDAQPWKNA